MNSTRLQLSTQSCERATKRWCFSLQDEDRRSHDNKSACSVIHGWDQGRERRELRSGCVVMHRLPTFLPPTTTRGCTQATRTLEQFKMQKPPTACCWALGDYTRGQGERGPRLRWCTCCPRARAPVARGECARSLAHLLATNYRPSAVQLRERIYRFRRKMFHYSVSDRSCIAVV